MSYIGKAPGFGIRNRYYYTATASQTTFSGADDNGQTLAYADSKYLDVYLNGVLLVAGTDYTATTLTSVTLTSGAAASDIVEIVAYDIFSVADTVSAANGGTFNGSITIDGGLSVDGGTIKLDGNYPVGTNNVGLGDDALSSLTTGTRNTAVGEDALSLTTTGVNNTAFGKNAVKKNVSGSYNTGIGDGALVDNTASNNTAVGYNALLANTTGTQNVAVGYQALDSNTTANSNTAVGYAALNSATTGGDSTAIGKDAGFSTTGINNTFVGAGSGYHVSTGTKNTIIGRFNGNQDGIDMRTSDNHVIISDGDGNVVFAKTNVTRLPDAGADGTSDGASAVLRTDGRLQRSNSSRRYKTEIQDASFGLSDAMNLRPVTFKGINDGDKVFAGFIAEEVDEAGLTQFVQYNADGDPETLSYGNLTSLCIKAIQELKAENDSLTARIEALENA